MIFQHAPKFLYIPLHCFSVSVCQFQLKVQHYFQLTKSLYSRRQETASSQHTCLEDTMTTPSLDQCFGTVLVYCYILYFMTLHGKFLLLSFFFSIITIGDYSSIISNKPLVTGLPRNSPDSTFTMRLLFVAHLNLR